MMRSTIPLVALLLGAATGAEAGLVYQDNAVSVRWDNTVRLSASYGLGSISSPLGPYCAYTASDSDCSYARGFRTGRLDILSELDATYREFGLHASAAAWYDAVDTETDSAERRGREIELFEGFLRGQFGSDRPFHFRIGRQTMLWGESLYFVENGIAAGQAPLDTYRPQRSGSYQGRDEFLPVGQASFSWQVSETVAIEGYYQFEWRRDRIDPEDAYAGTNDILGAEGRQDFATALGPRSFTYRRADAAGPGSSGQYGIALKLQSEYDFGLYFRRYTARTPDLHLALDPAASSGGRYGLAYARGIELYGLTASGSLGDASYSVELSARRGMNLTAGGLLVPANALKGADLAPRGDTLHLQVSWIEPVPPLPLLPDGATWSGEIAAADVLDVTDRPERLAAGRTRTAASFRTVFEPHFFQAIPRLDLSVPVGLRYNFLGLSAIDPAMNRGTGDVSIGVNATFDQVWRASIGFTHYFGGAKYVPLFPGLATRPESLSDWDTLSVSLERTF